MIKVNFLKTIKTQSSVLLVVSLILLLLTSVYIFSGCNIAGKTYTESNNGDNLNLKINDVITILSLIHISEPRDGLLSIRRQRQMCIRDRTSVYIFSGCNIAGKTYTESNNGDNLNLKINDVITI